MHIIKKAAIYEGGMNMSTIRIKKHPKRFGLLRVHAILSNERLTIRRSFLLD